MAISDQNAPSMTTTVLPNTISNAPIVFSNNSEHNSDLSKELNEMLQGSCPSTEFREFVDSMNPDDILCKHCARAIVSQFRIHIKSQKQN